MAFYCHLPVVCIAVFCRQWHFNKRKYNTVIQYNHKFTIRGLLAYFFMRDFKFDILVSADT